MSDAIDDLDLGDALDQLDLEPKPVSPAAPKVAPPTVPSAAATPQPQPQKEKPMPEDKKCAKCGHPLRSDNKLGICGDAAACRNRQTAKAPVSAPKPLVTLKARPQPTPVPNPEPLSTHYSGFSNEQLAAHISAALAERSKRLAGVDALRAAV